MKKECAKELNDCFESVKRMLEKRRMERQLNPNNKEELDVKQDNNKLEAIYKSIKGLRATIKDYFDSKESVTSQRRQSEDEKTNKETEFKYPNKSNSASYVHNKDSNKNQTEKVSIRL